MNKQIMQNIRDNAVKYLKNGNLRPQILAIQTEISVTQYAAYMYTNTLKSLHNFGGFSYEVADIMLFEAAEKAYINCNTSDILNDYNALFLYCLQQFGKGVDLGENTLDGATEMVDNGSKIVGISIAWLENYKH